MSPWSNNNEYPWSVVWAFYWHLHDHINNGFHLWSLVSICHRGFPHFQTGKWVCWGLQNWKIVICLSWYPSLLFVTRFFLFCSFCFYIVFFILVDLNLVNAWSSLGVAMSWLLLFLRHGLLEDYFLFFLSFHWTYLWSLDISLLSYFFQRFLDYKSLNHLNIFFSVKEFGIEKSKQKLSSSFF